MKKFVCLVAVIAMVMSLAISASAAPKDDIIAAIKNAVSAEVFAKYENTLTNTLNQLEITPAQAAQVINIVDETAKEVDLKEMTAEDFKLTKSEKEALVDNVQAAAEELSVKIEVKANKVDSEKTDIVIKKEDGKVIAQVDEVPVKKTGFELNTTVIMAVLAVVCSCAAAVVFGKSAKVLSK